MDVDIYIEADVSIYKIGLVIPAFDAQSPSARGQGHHSAIHCVRGSTQVTVVLALACFRVFHI